jgi:ADP-heptose:LPS heptosyltransferase
MRILCLQLKRIGDLILTAPALTALRESHPEAVITLVCDASGGGAGLLPAITAPTETVALRRGGWDVTVWRKVLSEPWDLCLDFTGTQRSALLSLASGAERRRTFRWVRRKGLRARAYGEFIDSSVRERHTVDHYLDLLAQPDEPLPESYPQAAHGTLTLPGSAVASAREKLQPIAEDDGDFFIIHAGAARPEKVWYPDRWARVIEHVWERTGWPVVLTGGPAPEEKAGVNAIERRLPEPIERLNLCGGLTLLETAAVIERGRFLAGVDTMALHLAGALEKPLVGLFGPTNPYHWRARRPDAVTLLAGEPGPVETFAPKHTSAPMDRLTVDAAISGVERVI